jgi:hypothetical protein
MRANNGGIRPTWGVECLVCRPDQSDTVRPFAASLLLIFSVFLMIFLSLNGNARAAAQLNSDNIKNLDSRWLPWIGSWRLVSNTVNESDSSLEGEFLLTITPGGERSSVVMTGSQDGLVLFDKKLVAIGTRQPVQESDCTGWYEYSWSDTGKRLLFNSESTCTDGRPRTISGISIFTNDREWSDIQLTQSGDERIITIRRYSTADRNLNALGIREAAVVNRGRVEAGTNLSIDEIIELSGKVAPEVLEAALIELRKPFKLDSKTLERLADAKVPPQVVDLMVAFTFPDRFTVERHTIAPIEKTAPPPIRTYIGYPYPWSPFGFWSLYDPLFPYYYYSSLAYWWGYGYWWNYPYWRPSFYPGGGYGIDRGRLIAGDGYSKVNPRVSGSGSRRARPRNGITRGTTGRSGGGYSQSTGSSGSSTPSGSGSSGGSSGSGATSGGGSSGGSSGSSAPSASPGGYSSGGGGGQAQHR